MPVLRHDDILESSRQAIDERNDRVAPIDRQRPARHEIGLQIDREKDVLVIDRDCRAHWVSTPLAAAGAASNFTARTESCLTLPVPLSRRQEEVADSRESLRHYPPLRRERTIQRADLTPCRPQRICMRPMPTLVLPFPAINPVLVQWGPLAIRWYALAYIAGLVLGWLLIRRIVSDDRYWNGKKRPSAESIDDLLVYCAFGVIIGGRVGIVLFYNPQYYFSHPIEIFKIWEGGMAFHGGLIGALIGILLFCRRYKAPALTVLDLCSLVAPIGIFLGRIANFIRPELWGRPTDVPWAVVFPGTDGLPRHPSQIYEALLEGLLAFVILYILAQMGALRRPGVIAGVFAIVYGAARIFSEFFREPDPQLGYLRWGLTMGMVLSLPLIIAGMGILAWSLPAGSFAMTQLLDEIRAMVAERGPISVEQYMQLALAHPDLGYYMNRDPFGATGDFTTAPEISQMFGELIGLWAAEVWSSMGSPDPVRLIELGPGRGTLMSDALRAARIVPAFRNALDVRLVETSPALAAMQHELLVNSGVAVSWAQTLKEVPDGPAIVIGNEFLDALPVRQFVRVNGQWRERRCV